MNLESNVFHTIQKHHMIEEGESVVAGISGGADSVCLLLCLKEYQKRVHFSLHVVHIDHGIRKEALLDAEFVKKLCEERDISFSLYHYDIPVLAKEWGMSEEEAGRKARYDAFRREARAQGGKPVKIAVAHHRNDLAETVLFQMFRGSGLKGLAGIQPVNGDIIRPLLSVSRKDIEAYLLEKGMTYQTDLTNLTDEYTRNKIRHHILPYVEQEINEQATQNIVRVASMASEADAYFQKKARRYLEEHRILQENLCISVEKLLQLEPIEIQYVLYACIEECAGARKDITAAHVDAVLGILHSTGTKRVELPYQVIVKKTYDLLFFEKRVEKKGMKENKGEVKEFVLEELFIVKQFPMEKNVRIPQNQYTKWFDYDKIKSECLDAHTELCVRTRKSKDILTIDDEGHTKSLKKYMIEEKIPQEIRDTLPIVVIGSQVVWLPGFRMSARYKITEQTNHVLELQFKEEEMHG